LNDVLTGQAVGDRDQRMENMVHLDGDTLNQYLDELARWNEVLKDVPEEFLEPLPDLKKGPKPPTP
jgi:hypothetical protein